MVTFPSAWRRMTVYAAISSDGEYHWRYTLKPLVDTAYWNQLGMRRLVSLQPPAPAMWAEYACRLAARLSLRERPNPSFGLRSTALDSTSNPKLFPVLIQRLLQPIQSVISSRSRHVGRLARSLRLAGYDVGLEVSDVVHLHGESGEGQWPPPPPPTDLEAVSDVLSGRQLSIREIEKVIERENVELERSVADCLSWLAVQGRVRQMPGIRRGALGVLMCMRCGETEQLRAWDCAACGERRCWQCEACRSLGLVRSCTVLYASPARQMPARRQSGALHRPVTSHVPPLTAAQQRAADALVEFVSADHPKRSDPDQARGPEHSGPTSERRGRDALVWAVCGAGKTEMSFAAVGKVLSRGGRVLFAVPRRDVVKQLGERLRKTFPDVELQVLHGGAERVVLPVLSPGSLTVATTHQVMRFYEAFDLVILDEVDAFPYRGSRMLAEAVVRATKSSGLRIRMTATPDKQLLRQVEAGESVLIRVPARYHGFPLPVPELVVDKSLGGGPDGGERGLFRPSPLLMSIINRSLAEPDAVRVLLFVPTIAAAERVGRGLDRIMPGHVLWSHARDRGRDEKLAAFLRGEARVFVATSILERGVTVPDVDVIVVYADAERIFQEPALIQMAGRVGRTLARPFGRVAFIGRRITPAMRMAVAHIERMNAEAAALGLLRDPVRTESGAEKVALAKGTEASRP